MELFGISPQELIIVAVVAVIVFGQRLPQVAGEAAATMQKLRRALNDLRRESGIDQEIRNARREIEQNVVQPLREVDLAGTVQREMRTAEAEIRGAIVSTSTTSSAPPDAASTPPETEPPTRPDPQSPPDPGPG